MSSASNVPKADPLRIRNKETKAQLAEARIGQRLSRQTILLFVLLLLLFLVFLSFY